jgi:hypothetical protein
VTSQDKKKTKKQYEIVIEYARIHTTKKKRNIREVIHYMKKICMLMA